MVEARVAQPLIDLQVLRRRSVAATNLTGFMVGVAMFSSFLILPAVRAGARGAPATASASPSPQAGLLLMPTALAQLLAGPPATRIAARDRLPRAADLGAVMITASFLINTFAHSHPWELVLGGILLGAGITFAFAAMANLIVDAVAAVRGRDRDRHQHRHAHRRRLVRRRRVDRDPHRLRVGELPLPTEGAYTAAFAFSAARACSRCWPRGSCRARPSGLSLEPARAGSR